MDQTNINPRSATDWMKQVSERLVARIEVKSVRLDLPERAAGFVDLESVDGILITAVTLDGQEVELVVAGPDVMEFVTGVGDASIQYLMQMLGSKMGGSEVAREAIERHAEMCNDPECEVAELFQEGLEKTDPDIVVHAPPPPENN